MFTKQFKPRS